VSCDMAADPKTAARSGPPAFANAALTEDSRPFSARHRESWDCFTDQIQIDNHVQA